MYADLHIHSWYSDRTMTVDEIVEQARVRHVSLIAVTDHNQLAGSRECLQKTRGTGIRCLSGVELDAQDFGINFHILGYGVDLENGQFQEFVEANRLRLERVNELLIEKMEHAGEPVSLDEYRQFSYDRRLGGWKALHYFAAKDLVADFKQGFLMLRWLSASQGGCPADSGCERKSDSGPSRQSDSSGEVVGSLARGHGGGTGRNRMLVSIA